MTSENTIAEITIKEVPASYVDPAALDLLRRRLKRLAEVIPGMHQTAE